MSKRVSYESKIKIFKDIKENVYKDKEICEKYSLSKGTLYRLKNEAKNTSFTLLTPETPTKVFGI